MKIGLLAAFTQFTANPANFARVAEALGFDSLWVPEHPIFPARPATKFPGGGEIPDLYSQMGDQIVALSMAAAVTTHLKLATGICLVPEHNPMVLANAIASLDSFSGGRLLFGIGAGWLREESEVLGVDFPRRWAQTAEYIAAMRELWAKPEASFEGKYLRFPPLRVYPKPAQKQGPPVIIGSLDKNAMKRIATWGDGWCPMLVPPAYLKSRVAELRDLCEARGRDFNTLEITAMANLGNDRSKVQEGLKAYSEAGAHRFAVYLGTLKPDNYEAELTKAASLYL